MDDDPFAALADDLGRRYVEDRHRKGVEDQQAATEMRAKAHTREQAGQALIAQFVRYLRGKHVPSRPLYFWLGYGIGQGKPLDYRGTGLRGWPAYANYIVDTVSSYAEVPGAAVLEDLRIVAFKFHSETRLRRVGLFTPRHIDGEPLMFVESTNDKIAFLAAEVIDNQSELARVAGILAQHRGLPANAASALVWSRPAHPG